MRRVNKLCREHVKNRIKCGQFLPEIQAFLEIATD